MLHFFCALFCESKPIIEFYNLHKLEEFNSFPIYQSKDKDITLTITGVGKTNAISAVEYHHESIKTSENDIWLNIGIAGHKSINVGEALLVNKITDSENKKCWYPQIVFKPPCDSIDLLSINSPSTEYKACLFDMEAAGFYQIAIKFGTAELVHCLKIVSDNNKKSISKINKDNVDFIIRNNLDIIEKLSINLKILAHQITPMTIISETYELYIKKWHFTQTEKFKLHNLLTKLQTRYSNENLFESNNHLRTGKLVLKALQNKLNNTNFSIN